MNNTNLFWFTPLALKELREFLQTASKDDEILQGINDEYMVAPIRLKASSMDIKSLVLALSLPVGSIPLYFTPLEKTYLLNQKTTLPYILEVLK